jgi:hypothetical protein
MPVTINGSAGVTTNSGAVYDSLQRGTAVTVSGTSVEFTSIPSWVRRITVMFSGVSTNGTATPQVQIGSSSYSTSNYLSVGMAITASNSGGAATTGFAIRSGNATATLHGAVVLTLISGNTWVASGNVGDYTNGALFLLDGTSPALSGALDRLRIIASSTGSPADTFDAGTINIIYE